MNLLFRKQAMLYLIFQFVLALSVPAVASVVDEIDELIDRAKVASGEGKYPEAELPLKQALGISVSRLGSMASVTGKLCRILADHYTETGNFQEAEQYLNRALVISSGYTGSTAQSDGRFSDTKNFINESLSNPSRLPGSIEVANTLAALSNLYTNQGRYADAERLLKRVVQIYQGAGSNPGNLLNYTPDAARILAESQRSLGQVLYKQGNVVSAEQSFKDYVDTVRKAHGKSRELSEALRHLSVFYESQNRSSDAIQCRKEADETESRN